MKRKYTIEEAAKLVETLSKCSNLKYVARITRIPIGKVRQVKEALRLKRS
ncbi:MAG: hypothetical protein ACTSQE_06925 [Candidatus Heimdallarchaeaceae archaeon]